MNETFVPVHDNVAHPEALTGRVALVTGAGGGIGASIVAALHSAGATVAAVDINESAASTVAEQIQGERGPGSRLAPFAADCGDVSAMKNVVREIESTLGPVEILVNNAGVARPASFFGCTEEDWDRIHRVNARGLFFLSQTVARTMLEHGSAGRIINIASISGRGYSQASSAVYAASKGAVIAITRIAALQLAQHGINVNAICPGPTATELSLSVVAAAAAADGVSAEEAMSAYTRPIPLGRFQEPQDIASLAVYLASNGSRNITGQCFNVDGGLLLS